MAQQNIIQQKEHSLQTLQAAVHRLESNIPGDQFQEIDEAGMRGPPDAHLHSQQWKSATPFSLPTPVLPFRPLSTAPDAPRSQQPIDQEIDTAFEIEMIKKQLINIQELHHAFSTTHALQPLRAPTHNDATSTLMLDMADELKHSRFSQDIKFKSYKDITDDVPAIFMLQDWKRTFARLRIQPSVAVILDKILQGGNLWKWYQSQCRTLTEAFRNMILLTTGPRNVLNALSYRVIYTKSLTTQLFAEASIPSSAPHSHQLRT
jgi:hypothetical protein